MQEDPRHDLQHLVFTGFVREAQNELKDFISNIVGTRLFG